MTRPASLLLVAALAIVICVAMPWAVSADPEPNGQEAARALGWGPVVDGDEFSDTALDRHRWFVYDGPGHNGSGLRLPSQVRTADGHLTINGDADGATGGLALSPGRMFGRWEVRMRVPKGASQYAPVLILWPDSQKWPDDGEVDFMETTADSGTANFNLHYSPSNRVSHSETDVDLTVWHNYAVEWTPRGIYGYVDGVRFFADENLGHLPPGPMHPTIQLDWLPDGNPTTPSSMDVDWIRVYDLGSEEES